MDSMLRYRRYPKRFASAEVCQLKSTVRSLVAIVQEASAKLPGTVGFVWSRLTHTPQTSEVSCALFWMTAQIAL